MKFCKAIVSLLLALMLCLGSVVFAEEGFVYQKGDKIEDFTVTTWDNQTITLSEVLKEKKMVLINIWATWCGPCRNEFPFMEEAYKQYQDQIEIIALSCEETDTPDVLADFVENMGMTFKVAQDTPDFATKFGVTGIPTSIVVDRNGVICFIESGSLPDVGSFTRLFDVFVADDYTEPVMLNSIPPMKPNVPASAEADVAAALEVAAATNPTDEYTWPMIVAEQDGRSVVRATNKGVNSSEAVVDVKVSAKAGDAIVVTFKTSTEVGCDLLNIAINGEKVKVFGGEHDWMTYAIPVEADGDYAVTLSYVKDMMAEGGEDTVWVDTVAVVSGDEAAAALAANPAYPVAEANAMTVKTETAKEIVISDEAGILPGAFGPDAKYYIVNADAITVTADVTAAVDPEGAYFYSYYDGQMAALSTAVADGAYAFTTGVDALETTGYTYSYVMVYLNPEGTETMIVVYFMNEENANAFVTNNGLGTWQYADATAPSTDALPEKEAKISGTSDYVLKCVDQDGNPVAGVMLQVCDEATCQVFLSDENGQYAFTSAAYAWEVHILKAPEGYTADSTDVVLAPVEGGEMVFTLTKN